MEPHDQHYERQCHNRHLVGGIAGGAIGCVLGGIVGATVASATIIGLFGPFIPPLLWAA